MRSGVFSRRVASHEDRTTATDQPRAHQRVRDGHGHLIVGERAAACGVKDVAASRMPRPAAAVGEMDGPQVGVHQR